MVLSVCLISLLTFKPGPCSSAHTIQWLSSSFRVKSDFFFRPLFLPFSLTLLVWHWSIKLYRFHVYNSITCHRYDVLGVDRPRASLHHHLYPHTFFYLLLPPFKIKIWSLQWPNKPILIFLVRCFILFIFYFLKDFIYLFLVSRREGERGRETSMCGCLSHTPSWGLGPQPRHVPWPRMEPATLCFAGWCSSTELHEPELFLFYFLFIDYRKKEGGGERRGSAFSPVHAFTGWSLHVPGLGGHLQPWLWGWSSNQLSDPARPPS